MLHNLPVFKILQQIFLAALFACYIDIFSPAMPPKRQKTSEQVYVCLHLGSPKWLLQGRSLFLPLHNSIPFPIPSTEPAARVAFPCRSVSRPFVQ